MIPSSLIPGLRTYGTKLAQTDTVYLYTPYRAECEEYGCGPNEATGGGLDPSCAVCGGTGWTEMLMPSVLKCRTRWWYGPDASFVATSGVQSGELGDIALSLDPQYQAALEEAHSNSKSYFEVDGYKAKIFSIVPSRLNGVITSLDVQCNLSREDRDGQADNTD
jgi:hypothetical protein